ncbi:muellerian-inhibiting factor [Python bivittatus]|uniref:Muellerian-inhibiting factor n=1 Tax=Python bivittatus TaxID=176946 RepID=A0A9F2RCD4_PYTBI|nr:muellerian-inhibiting factor [Python bivittatus]
MQLGLASILLGLWLTAESLSSPARRNHLEESPQRPLEGPTLGELKSPEEEDQVKVALDFEEPPSKVVVVSRESEDSPGHFPPHQPLAEEVRPLSLWPQSGSQPWLHGSSEESVCHVRLDGGSFWGPNHLEVGGLLSRYDSGFLKALRRSVWSREDLETFGICPSSPPHSLLGSLQHVADSLGRPGGHRFFMLHLEEVKWEAETKLRFKLTFQKDVEEPLSSLQLVLLVFYQGEKELVHHGVPKKFLMGGEGLHQKQVVCLSRGTRYLVLQGSVLSGRHSPGELSYELSLEIRHQNNTDAAVSSDEAQDLLFGFDAKCFTRRTPAVLLLVKQSFGVGPHPPTSFLSADGKLDALPYLKPSSLLSSGVAHTPSEAATIANQTNTTVSGLTSPGYFLGTLSQFVNKVLNPSGEPPASQGHLRLDFDTMEGLPHELLNLSEKVAFEWLVQSENHLVVLFPENSQAFMEHHLGQWHLEGKLLRQLLQKLQSVIRELRAMPSFQANADLFRTLLTLCYYPSRGLEEVPTSDPGEAEETQARRKIHSLLLLKALQVVRARWREARKVSLRANRSTQVQDDYCRLRELRISLVSTRYIILPESYNANNCVGPCQSPLSTRIPDYYSHTIFLLRMYEQGMPLQRAPCCVPVKYSQSLMVTFTSDQGMIVKVYPDMVAESCGCR